MPVEVSEGDKVLAGAMNVDGLLQVELTRVGEESTLGRIISLMQDAENAKPPVTRLLDRYAGQYMALVLLVAAGTWLITANVPAMLAVLVASCPCALVLAAPATAVAAIAVAARHGILIKGSAFLEHLSDVSAVIFDKTGTMTTGDLRLTDLRPAEGVDPEALRQLGASLGATSNHPVEPRGRRCSAQERAPRARGHARDRRLRRHREIRQRNRRSRPRGPLRAPRCRGAAPAGPQRPDRWRQP